MSAKTEKLEFRCSQKLRDALIRVAEAQEMTLSDVIRAACEDYTAPYAAVRVPIVGIISQKGIEFGLEETAP